MWDECTGYKYKKLDGHSEPCNSCFELEKSTLVLERIEKLLIEINNKL